MRHKRTNCTFNQGFMNNCYQQMQNTTCLQGQTNQQTNNQLNQQPMCQAPVYQMQGNTTYETLAPIVTSSKNVVNTYHVQKQPYIHNYHTEVVHHHIKQCEFIPNYTCSETNVTNC